LNYQPSFNLKCLELLHQTVIVLLGIDTYDIVVVLEYGVEVPFSQISPATDFEDDGVRQDTLKKERIKGFIAFYFLIFILELADWV
jgi:hypothetical protein